MGIYLDIYNEEFLSLKKNLDTLQKDLLYIQEYAHSSSLELKGKKDRKYHSANFIKEKCLISRSLLNEIEEKISEIDILMKI